MSIEQASARLAKLPNGDPATWIRVEDLVLPPDEQRRVDAINRRYGGLWGLIWDFWGQLRRSTEKHAKLRYFFPALDLALKTMPRGLYVLMAGAYYSPEFSQFLHGL